MHSGPVIDLLADPPRWIRIIAGLIVAFFLCWTIFSFAVGHIKPGSIEVMNIDLSMDERKALHSICKGAAEREADNKARSDRLDIPNNVSGRMIDFWNRLAAKLEF